MPKTLLLTAAAAVAGCALEPAGTTSTEVQPTCSQSVLPAGTSASGCATCSNPLTCQGNTNIVAGTGIWELDGSMTEYNARGFKITAMGYTDPGGAEHGVTTFTVDGASVTLKLDNGQTITPFNVPGLHMSIHYALGRDYQLKIIPSAITVPYYDLLATPLMVGYHIEYLPQDGPADGWVDLCANKVYTEHGLATVYALISKGDRIDPATGAVTASGSKVGSWFQISCAEDVWTKVLRTHTGGAVAPATTTAQRTATSFMFTADYCGNAEHDTIVGTDIAWADLSEGMTIPVFPPVSAESVWTEHGALCLSTPRKWDPVSCAKPPTCTGDQLDHWFKYGWLKSAAP